MGCDRMGWDGIGKPWQRAWPTQPSISPPANGSRRQIYASLMMVDDAGTYLILPLPGHFWKCHLVISGNGDEGERVGGRRARTLAASP